jgi:hypothetical protein
MTPEQRLERAHDLIKVKRYDDARRLLERIDDPRAAALLTEIAGMKTPAPAQPRFSPETARRIKIAVVVVVLAVLAFGVFRIIEIASKGSARSAMFSWCVDEGVHLLICRDWVTVEEESHLNEITACYEQSPDAPFRECLADKGIMPPQQ